MSEGQRTSGGNWYSPTMCVSGTEFGKSGLALFAGCTFTISPAHFSVFNQQLQLRGKHRGWES